MLKKRKYDLLGQNHFLKCDSPSEMRLPTQSSEPESSCASLGVCEKILVGFFVRWGSAVFCMGLSQVSISFC